MVQGKQRFNPYLHAPGSKVPVWLRRRPEVSMGAKMLYGTLQTIAGDEGYCYPSQGYLSLELGISERQLRRYTVELIHLHLIETERSPLDAKRLNYYFLEHPWIVPYKAQTTPDTYVRGDRTDMSGDTGQKRPVQFGECSPPIPDTSVRQYRTDMSGEHNKEGIRREEGVLPLPAFDTGQGRTVNPTVARTDRYLRQMRDQGQAAQAEQAKIRSFVESLPAEQVEQHKQAYLSTLPDKLKAKYAELPVLGTRVLLNEVYRRAQRDRG